MNSASDREHTPADTTFVSPCTPPSARQRQPIRVAPCAQSEAPISPRMMQLTIWSCSHSDIGSLTWRCRGCVVDEVRSHLDESVPIRAGGDEDQARLGA